MPKPGDVFGRYEITTRIGRGGMGVVFSARQVDLNREVALKLLSPDLADSPEYRNRFAREASALGRIDSPHVIHVYEAGEHDGWLFIATQLVDGGDLQQWMSDNGPLTPYAAADLVAQVAIGLRDAHQLGILHRDIKPSNVLLKNTDDGLRAYLCDLGISQLLDAEHTRTTGAIGTLGYMAPERHEGSDASVASDIYALGCLLWAALTGTAPYTGTDMHVALAHVREPVRQLDSTDPASILLNEIMATAMAKNAADRYPDASSMISDLRRVLVAVGAEVAEQTMVRPVVAPAPEADAEGAIDQTTSVRHPVLVEGVANEVLVAPRPRRNATVAAGVAGVLLAAGGGWIAFGQGNDPVSSPKASDVATGSPTVQQTPSSTPTPNLTLAERAAAAQAALRSVQVFEFGAGGTAGLQKARRQGNAAGWEIGEGLGASWAVHDATSRIYYGPGLRSAATLLGHDLGIDDIRPSISGTSDTGLTLVVSVDYPAR